MLLQTSIDEGTHPAMTTASLASFSTSPTIFNDSRHNGRREQHEQHKHHLLSSQVLTDERVLALSPTAHGTTAVPHRAEPAPSPSLPPPVEFISPPRLDDLGP